MVIDSSTLISLARSGRLELLGRLPVAPVILDAVARETVEQGMAGGHADAAAIQAAIAGLPSTPSGDHATVDAAVLASAQRAGTLVANDLALGRRARNLGVNWLRTADLVLLLVRTQAVPASEGHAAIAALASAGRISFTMAADYQAELP